MSHGPVTLENWISFLDVQMILVPFFEIPHGDRLAKNVKSLCVQVIPRSMSDLPKGFKQSGQDFTQLINKFE